MLLFDIKICTKCGIAQSLDRFHKSVRATGAKAARGGFGVASQCKLCRSESRKPGLQLQREQQAALTRAKFKTCGKCKVPRPFSDFHKRVASWDGLAFKCKACINADSKAWRDLHPGAHARWYQENKERKASYFKEWRAANAATEPARVAAWAKANPERVNANIARRNAAKLRAIPAWANHEAIARVYAEAAQLRRTTGDRYEVDHIIPLQGQTVSGLHWEGNLQILLKAENISKHNRRWPGMPTDVNYA